MKISDVVAKYIELRDKKAEMKKEYEAKVANTDKNLAMIEAKLLEYFNKTGVESCRTENGTVFSSHRNQASIADRDAFMNFVRENDAWEMLITRANPKVIDEYQAANDNNLPPGINWNVERVVTFRRA